MGHYELTVLLAGKPTAAKKKTVQKDLEDLVKVNKGLVKTFKDWGEKELAQVIKGETVGNFLYYELELEEAHASEVKNSLRLKDELARTLFLKVK